MGEAERLHQIVGGAGGEARRRVLGAAPARKAFSPSCAVTMR
jgi:hypothetical protein